MIENSLDRVTIAKYLKEILEILQKMNKDMAEIKEAVVPAAEYRFDEYSAGMTIKNGEEL